jgi:hypothetical protein
LLALKLNSLWKHGGKRKNLIVAPKICKFSEYYMNKVFVHAKNEHLHVTTKKDIVA